MLSPEGDFSLSWDEGCSILDDFVAQVAEWLRQSDFEDVYLWARSERPLEESVPTLQRAIELLTGHATGSLERLFGARGLSELLTTLSLDGGAQDPAASSQCQILRDLSPTLPEELGEVLLDVVREAAAENREALLRWRRSRAIALDAARPAELPQEAGQLAAIELRRALELDGKPIPDTAAVLEQAGLSYRHVSVASQHDRMIVGLRDYGSLVARTLESPRTQTQWGRRLNRVGRSDICY